MALGTVDDAEFQAWASRVKRKINSGKLKQEIGQSSKRIGVQALRQFKANTPAKTGELRRAWTAEGPSLEGNSWVVTLMNNAEYASYVENGHRQTPGRFVPSIHKKLKASWVPGQFFMKRSVLEVNSQLPELVTPNLWAFRNLLS